MAKKALDVPTPSVEDIAKKWKLNIPTVKKAVRSGKKVEKEHTTDTKKAAEIARDHLGERPDYYKKLDKMEKSKIAKEETEMDIEENVLSKKRIGYRGPAPEGTIAYDREHGKYRALRKAQKEREAAKKEDEEKEKKTVKEALHLHLKKNALHHDLGIPEGEKIPQDKLQDALHSNSKKLRKRAQFAVNASHWHHGKKKAVNETWPPYGKMHRPSTSSKRGDALKELDKAAKEHNYPEELVSKLRGTIVKQYERNKADDRERAAARRKSKSRIKEEIVNELTTKFLKRYTKAAHEKWDTMSDEERKSKKGHNMVKGVDTANRHISRGGHIREEQEMNNDKVKGLIRESIENIQAKKLTKLQETINAAIALKVANRLEEAKADIAKTYFAK